MEIVNSQHLSGPLRESDFRSDRNLKEIIVHRQSRADGTPWESVRMFADWIKDPSNKWGLRIFPYHYYISPNGVVHNVLPVSVRGQHAAGRNTRSIGIALAVDGRKKPPTHDQWLSLQKLCRILLKLYPHLDINGHSKLKRCPGKFVDIERLRVEVQHGRYCESCGRTCEHPGRDRT